MLSGLARQTWRARVEVTSDKSAIRGLNTKQQNSVQNETQKRFDAEKSWKKRRDLALARTFM